jgi:metallo-beta-lactamase class B
MIVNSSICNDFGAPKRVALMRQLVYKQRRKQLLQKLKVTALNTWILALFVILAWDGLALDARAQADAAGAHVAAAKAAVSPKAPNPQPWQAFNSAFNQMCAEPKAGARPQEVGKDIPLEPGEAAKLTPTPREKWYAPPAKVFDNLYYIGTKTESTWALTTSAGVILINTNFDWVTPALLDELRTFGLDPANIKYAIIVRSHSDQSWGINALKKVVPSARVIMSEGDWDFLADDNSPAKVKPVKDMVAKDGQKVTLGDTTVVVYSTPGASAGSLSFIFPVKDGNQQHLAGMIGGTTMNLAQGGVQVFPDTQTMIKTYIASARRFKEVEDKAGVDTIISIHAALDNMFEKVDALHSRKPGDAHPFVSKDDVDRFSTIVIECGEAKLAWANSN